MVMWSVLVQPVSGLSFESHTRAMMSKSSIKGVLVTRKSAILLLILNRVLKLWMASASGLRKVTNYKAGLKQGLDWKGQVINRVSNFFCHIIDRVGKIVDFGHKQGTGFGKWCVHLQQIFLVVEPPGSCISHHEKRVKWNDLKPW